MEFWVCFLDAMMQLGLADTMLLIIWGTWRFKESTYRFSNLILFTEGLRLKLIQSQLTVYSS
jgi:hypothetical protein